MSRDIWEARSRGAMTCFTYSCPKTYQCTVLPSFTVSQSAGKWAVSNHISLHLHPQVWTCGKDKNSTIWHAPPKPVQLLLFCLCSEVPSLISCVPCMWEERPAPWYSLPHTWETLKVPDCGWEFENMLNYSLPDPSLSEEGGASSPQTSATEASSVTLASLTHRFTRHPEISALGALLHSEIPLHSHWRTPNLAFLLDINQQNIKHDTGFLSATMCLQRQLWSTPKIPSKSHTYPKLCRIHFSLASFEHLKSSICPYSAVEVHLILLPKAPLQQFWTKENMRHWVFV